MNALVAGRRPVRAFEVWCVLFAEFGGFKETVNAYTAGEAKSDRHRSINEAWPGVPFTSMRARVIGGPRSSEDFVRCATRRGYPDVRCGDPVELPAPDGRRGVIVSHTGSANWDVLFDDGSSGAVHPDSCIYPKREAAQ